MVTGFSIGRGAANKEAEDEEAHRREELKRMTVEMIEHSREDAMVQARQAAASAQAAAQNMAQAAAVADYNSASSADSAETAAVNAQSETQATNVTMDAVSSGYGDDVVTAADNAGVGADNIYGMNDMVYDDGRIEQVGDQMYEQGQIDDPELDDEYARRYRGSVENNKTDETEDEIENPYDEPVYDEEQPALDDQMQQDINQQVRDSLEDEDFDSESDDLVYDDTVYDENDLNIGDIDDDYIDEYDGPVYDEDVNAELEPEPEPQYTEPEPEPQKEMQEDPQEEMPALEPDDDDTVDMQREADRAINDVDMTPGTNVPDDNASHNDTDVEQMQSPISDEQIAEDAGGDGDDTAGIASELDDAAGDLGMPEQSSASSLTLEDVSMSRPTMLSSIYNMCDSVGLADELSAYTGVDVSASADAGTSVVSGNAREEQAQSESEMMSYIDQANQAMMKAVGPVADLKGDDLTSKLTSGIGGMMSML